MPNVTYIATRDIQRRGRKWTAGQEIPEAHALPVWRDHLITAGAIRVAGYEEVAAAAASNSVLPSMTVAEVVEHVAGIDDVDALRPLSLEEEGGKGRVGAVNAINARIDELTPGTAEAD